MRKYTKKDWKCPTLGLVGLDKCPLTKSKVVCLCPDCGVERIRVFAEVLRSATKQSRLSDHLSCHDCYCSLPAYREESRSNSVAAASRPGVAERASKISSDLWLDPEYRNNHSLVLRGHSDSSKSKMSEAAKKKFTDPLYIEKIKRARKSYWNNQEYRAARVWTISDFIARAVSVHGNRYSYSDTEYFGFKTKLAIRCPEHGIFLQLPGHHIHFANGCPTCVAGLTRSAGEIELSDWVTSLGVKTLNNDRSMLGGAELDIFLPDKMLAIEYNGLYWHSSGAVELSPQRYRHHFKTTLCDRHNITLLQFYDFEWRDKQDTVKSMISNKLGLSTRIGARRLELVYPTESEAQLFFEKHHLQGHRHASSYYGLARDNEILVAIAISRRDTGHELIRFAVSHGVSVAGGLSKLLLSASRSGIKTIFTYADRRYSNCVGYNAVGFKHLGLTPPGYRYFKNGIIYSRQKFQKHKLPKLLSSFDPSLSEAENMFAAGYRRIWDAGHHRLEIQL